MYFYDVEQHFKPHIHVQYAGVEAVFEIPNGRLLVGNFPGNKLKLVRAWIEIHQEELMANWELASKGITINKIDPLE